MDNGTAYGVDGGFAKDGLFGGVWAESETAEILSGAGCQAAPGVTSSTSQFGANGTLIFSAQQEDGIGIGIGIERAGVDERFKENPGKATFRHEVVLDFREVDWYGYGKRQAGFRYYRFKRCLTWTGEVMGEPLDGGTEVHDVQMHRQIDGTPSAKACIPVDEFRAIDRHDALSSVPFVFITQILVCPTESQNGFQRYSPQAIGVRTTSEQIHVS